ncbi:uncharacterized protein LOC114253149 [Bombyx mandarina]|uniref:Endonuclease-reverse transcriptase n=2 Tax=Bombyx TaxID=7090 RepID=A0A8R2R803_BOMMO|nr:uncharacterized protein LOC101743231 [Bombyx mori]XP_028038144.1 uncharacterized protein LOC114248911 [Bombyx mandarina]XP_028043723.1 uncharacterized protein LOC114253149 [Bombyx mandarina]XP_037877340.1 uncharacterized protein LOC119630866 [Bombyx mori]
MEEVLNTLISIKKELEEQRIEIRETGKNVTEKVTQNITSIFEEKFLVWEGKLGEMKEKVENQEKRIHYLEKQTRVRNLVFFGIEENETSYKSFEENIIKWIEQYFSIKLTYSDIQEIKRLGKKQERPRPTVVTFTTLGIKIEIFKQKRALKDTQYYMKEDFPKYVLEKRKALQEQLKLEREKGNTAILKYDKLIVSKYQSKRKYRSSPDNTPQINIDKYTQASKKNKTKQIGKTVTRSNSITEGVIKPSMLNFLVNKNTIKTNNNQESNSENI